MKIYFPSAGSLCNIDEAGVKRFSKSPIQVYAQQYYCEKLVEHIKNSCFQAVRISKEYEQNANLPDSRLWG